MKRLTLLILVVLVAACAPADDPLPSWREGPVKDAITEWLAAVTDPQSPDHIPVAERLAVLDNDGTLWCERPEYVPTVFQVDLARSLAAVGHVDAGQMPWPAWFADDQEALEEFGWSEAYRAFTGAFEGMPVEAYHDSAQAFVARARHPRWGVPYTDLYYRPMIELKDLLEAHDFQVWVVTAAEQDFVRAYIEDAFGVPPERTMGGWVTPIYNEAADGGVELVRGDRRVSNSNVHKPENIFARIGRRPVFAAGNSDNDEPMCRYAVTGARRGLAIWIRHDDAEREYHEEARAEAIEELCRTQPGAHEVSMKDVWSHVFVGVAP